MISKYNDGNKIPLSMLGTIFDKIDKNKLKTNQINSNNTFPIELPIEVSMNENNQTSFITVVSLKSYMELIKKSINTKTEPKINFDKHVFDRIVSVNKENEEPHQVLILEILPHSTEIIQYSDDKKYYIRIRRTEQSDHGSCPINGDVSKEIKKKHLIFPQKLFEEALNNNLEKVRTLLRESPSLILKVDNNGNNVFVIACKHNSWEVIKHLLNDFRPQEKRVFKNKLTKDDLEKALAEIDSKQCKNEKLNIGQLIERINTLVYFHINNKKNLFRAVSRDNDLEKIKELLNQEPDLIKATNQFGETIFLKACEQINEKAIKYFLDNCELTKDELEKGLKRMEKIRDEEIIPGEGDETIREINILINILECKIFVSEIWR